MMRFFFALVVCLVVSRACYSQEKTIRIGAVLSLSGPAAEHGHGLRSGIELAKEDLKAKGYKVDIAYEDDGTNPSRTVSAIHSLVARGYKFFIGPTWSYLVEASLPVITKAGVLAISPSTSSAVIGGSSPMVFMGAGRVQSQISPLVDWLKANQIKSVAIVYAESLWGRVHRDVFLEAAKIVGIPVVAVREYNYGDEATSIINVIFAELKGSHPDAFLTTGSMTGVAQMTKAMVELKMSSKLLGMDDMVDAWNAKLIPAGVLKGQLFSLATPISEDFSRKFRQAYKREPYLFSDIAYESLLLMVKAIESSDGSTEGVRKYLSEIPEGEPWHFDSNRDIERTGYRVVAIQ